MLIPLPHLSNAGALPLPEAAAPLRDSAGSGPDFSQLMQQQADRQAALRAVDQQVGANTRGSDGGRPAATPATPRPAADAAPRAPEAEPGPRSEPAAHRSDTGLGATARAEPARADADTPAAEAAPDAARQATARPETPARPRPAPAHGSSARNPATPPADNHPADESAAPDAGAAALAGGTGPSTAQWARHRRAVAGVVTDPLLTLPSATSGTQPGTQSGTSEPALHLLPADATNPTAVDLAATGAWPGQPLPMPGPPLVVTADGQAASSPAADHPATIGVQALASPAATAPGVDTTLPAPVRPLPAAPLPVGADGPHLAAGASAQPLPIPGQAAAAASAAATMAQPAPASPVGTQPATAATAADPVAASATAGPAQGPAPAPTAPVRGTAADNGTHQAGVAARAAGAGLLSSMAASMPANASRATARQGAGGATPVGATPAGGKPVADSSSSDGVAVGATGSTTASAAAAATTTTPGTTANAELPTTTAQPQPVIARSAAVTAQPGTHATGSRADDASAPVRPAATRLPQGGLPEPTTTATGADRPRPAQPGDTPAAEVARATPDTPAAASVQPAPPQAAPAAPLPPQAERALQALGAAAQAAARHEALPQQTDTAAITALPPATAAAAGPASANTATPASPAMAEVRVPVPLDSPAFGAALGTQVSVLVRDGVQTARLQLNPAEMGPISVQIALDGSAARVDFQADLAGTRAVIEASLPALASALQEAGLTLAGGGVSQQTPGRQGQGDPSAQPGQASGANGPARQGDLPSAAVPTRTQRGLVDLVA